MRESARSRLLARTSEIIFDIGGSSEEGLKSVLGFGWQAARIYRAGKDKLPLARIVMSLASGYRLVGDARLSRSLSGTAHHILDRFADRSRQEDLELLQRALMSQLRHHLESGIRQTEMEKIRRMLINITTTVDSAYAKVEAEKELLGYCAQFDEKIAPQKSLEFKELVSNTPGLPKFGGAGRWRPDIERLILEGDRIGASEIMTGPFLSAFQEEPHLHYRRLLVEWNEDYDLGIEQELSRTPAQYVSPIQMSAPRRPQD
jgi:hypothetical protein